MVLSVKNRRATLFSSSSIQFNENMVKTYVDEFSPKTLVPSVNKGKSIKITPNGLATEDIISLELKKLDESFKVVFGADRIDIESIKEDETMSDFLALAKDIEMTLSTNMHLSFVRLALCENVEFYITDSQRSSAYKIFAKEDSPVPIEWQFLSVKRTSVASCEAPAIVVPVNEVYNVRCPEKDGDSVIILEMDINTKVGASVDQISAIKNNFWPYASGIIDSYVSDYKTKLLDGSNQ